MKYLATFVNHVWTCPVCGYIEFFKTTLAERNSKVVTENGVLVEKEQVGDINEFSTVSFRCAKCLEEMTVPHLWLVKRSQNVLATA